ncbi:MAG: hypothetical protein IKJ56_09585, partial [Bacteroidales bacterium]|nr:hypothetical protein [Bacteroidales bacterium]
FLWLRRFYVLRTFEWLRRFNVLRTFEWLRRFYGFAVSGFLWLRRFYVLRTFEWLRRFTLTLFLYASHVSVFNFVEGFAVHVSVATPFEWHYLSPVPLGTMLR